MYISKPYGFLGASKSSIPLCKTLITINVYFGQQVFYLSVFCFCFNNAIELFTKRLAFDLDYQFRFLHPLCA